VFTFRRYASPASTGLIRSYILPEICFQQAGVRQVHVDRWRDASPAARVYVFGTNGTAFYTVRRWFDTFRHSVKAL